MVTCKESYFWPFRAEEHWGVLDGVANGVGPGS